MTKTCLHCQKSFEITNADMAFYDKVSPTFAGKKYSVPPPTLCPDCRKQRRLSWRNERSLYNSTCALCQKSMVSLYPPDTTFTVYCNSCWWSDKWEPRDFGTDYDFSKSFYEQFKKLQQKVPRLALFNSSSENAEYSNHAANNKNCYLIFSSFFAENVYYSRTFMNGRDSMDCISCMKNCQLCYESIQCENCYNVKFSRYSKNCSDSFFLYDCSNVRNSYRCVGLHNKEFCFENEQLTKEEYFKHLPYLGSYATLQAEKEKTNQFIARFPQRSAHFLNCQDCTGDEQMNCISCEDSYDIQDCQNVRYCETTEELKDAYDCYGAGKPGEMLYEIHAMLDGYASMFCHASYHNSFIYYCDTCQNSQNLFGCVSIKKGQYCILNKQYTKEEYETLVGKIIGQMTNPPTPFEKGGVVWGEFFPSLLSPFGYNETLAQEYFPLTREDVLGAGVDPIHELGLHEGNDDTKQGNTDQPLPRFKWSDYENPKPQVEKIITAEQMKQLPDDIKHVPDEMLNWALTCEVSGKPFRIIKQELKFYREHGLPIPRRHHDQRHKDRLSLRNPRQLWERQCDCENSGHSHAVGDADRRPLHRSRCENKFQTTFAPDREEKVYCEDCYRKEVY